MEALVRKKSILMSIFMGISMGIVFTLFAQLKNQHTIIPMGIVTGILISVVISVIIGLIVPIKKLYDTVCEKLNIQGKPIPSAIATSLVSDIIFTPLNCCIGMWFGMSMGLKDLPPDVVSIFDKLIYCTQLPYFVPALISTLLIDLIIGFVLCLLISPFINKLTNKMCGI